MNLTQMPAAVRPTSIVKVLDGYELMSGVEYMSFENGRPVLLVALLETDSPVGLPLTRTSLSNDNDQD